MGETPPREPRNCNRALSPAVTRRPPARPARTWPRIICPPCDSAGRKLPVQRQQAAHSLRVGGHLGLYEHGVPRRWLWLELGSGNLLAELSQVRVTGQHLRRQLARPQPAICVWWEPSSDVRGEGVKRLPYGQRDRTRAALPDECRSTCGSGSGYGNAPTKRGGSV